jgi:hypothetical protein
VYARTNDASHQDTRLGRTCTARDSWRPSSRSCTTRRPVPMAAFAATASPLCPRGLCCLAAGQGRYTPTGAVRRSRRPAEQPIKQLYDATRPTRQPVSFLRCLPVVCRVRVLLCHAWDRVDRSRPTPTSMAGGAGDVHANRSSAPQHAAGRAERATQHAAGDAGGDSCEQRVGGRWLTRR